PAEQPLPPRDRAVHERLLLVVPDRIGGDVQRGGGGIDKRVGRLDDNALRNSTAMFFRLEKQLRQFLRAENFSTTLNRQQRQENRLRGQQSNFADDHRQNIGCSDRHQQPGEIYPLFGVRDGVNCPPRRDACNRRGFAAKNKSVCGDGEFIAAALLRAQLKKLRNRLALDRKSTRLTPVTDQ